jgi:hypothetical protein
MKALFTIAVSDDRTSVHTQASGDVDPATALDAAISALQHERRGLKACPAHRDNGSRPEGENSRSEVEGEARQSGSPQGEIAQTNPA